MHHGAYGGDIGTIATGFHHIDINAPVNPWQRAAVFDLGQGLRGFKLLPRDFRGAQKIIPIAALEAQMQRFSTRRASGQHQYFGLNSRYLVKFILKCCQNQIAVQIGSFAAIFPWDGFQLDLANRVFGPLCAPSIAVQTSVSGKGKSIFDPGMGQNNCLGLTHQFIFLLQREIAAGFHIDDGLFCL